ncbi:MAG: hypothetical protein CVV42_06020 [Candidatus Riflebacteria bacterium HGW-Riflebacteria-2]|jgi:hypothetical protein|nr:MAG: hypothetical protein CVV42_06020 [Candidatus Riflebacteria bacterium HGW-Riflebacteria-2]
MAAAFCFTGISVDGRDNMFRPADAHHFWHTHMRFEGIDSWQFKPVQVGTSFGFDTGIATGAWGRTTFSGKYEVSPLFQKVCRFMHGYAPIKLYGRWGIIDTSAMMVIEPDYEKVWSPMNNKESEGFGLQFFGEDDDTFNVYEVDPLEDWTNGFEPGIFPLYKNNRWHLLDRRGELNDATYERMLPMNFERAAVFSDGRWGFLDRAGSLTIPLDFYSVGNFSEGLAAVRLEDLWGYIDVTGTFIIPEQFAAAEEFSSGTAIITVNGKHGIIDTKGQYLLKPEYYYIFKTPDYDFLKVYSELEVGLFHRTDGLILPVIYDHFDIYPDRVIIAKKDRKKCIVDFEGQVLLPLTEADITPLGDECLLISSKDALTILDTRDKSATRTDFKNIRKFCNELAAFQAANGKWGFLDRELKPAIAPQYSWVSDFSWYQAAVESETGITIINNFGRPVDNPRVDKRPMRNHKGWQLVWFNDRLGVQDENGVWCIRPDYTNIRMFSTGVTLAKSDYYWTLHLLEEIPSGNQRFEDVGFISENRCWVKSEGKYGYLDEKGKMLIPLQFDQAREMKNGMAAVKKNSRWGFINAQGEQVFSFIFTKIIPQSDKSYIVYEDNRKGYITAEGKYLPSEAKILPAERELH